MGVSKLSFQYFLDSAAAALRDVGPLVVSDPESLEKVRLRARFAPPTPELASGEPADTELQGVLSGALFRIMDEYDAGVGRMPRLSEVLGTFAFSLSGSTERFFSDTNGLRLLDSSRTAGDLLGSAQDGGRLDGAGDPTIVGRLKQKRRSPGCHARPTISHPAAPASASGPSNSYPGPA